MAGIVMDQIELRLQAHHIMKEYQKLQKEQEKSIYLISLLEPDQV